MSGEAPLVPADAIDRAVHDLNNVCATIFGFASLATDDAEPGSSLEQYLTEINRAAERCNAVAQRLHELSKTIRSNQGV